MTTISGNNITLTASNLVDSIGGLIQRIITTNSTDTLPTAANIITAFTGSNISGNIGQSFTFTIYNNSSFLLTITTSTGVSLIDGTTTDVVSPECTRVYTVIQTAVSTVMIYMLGNGTVSPETNTDIYLADGKILVGNTSNIATSTTLAAGSGINISNGGGGGTVTIATTGGTGTVTSVNGTTNRITITGTPTVTPVVDIASTYVGQTSIITLGTITSGTWNGTVMNSTYGGTGVNNSSRTITLGGNLTTSGAFATTLTSTANTSVTLPTSGTLLNNTLTSANFYVGNVTNVATGVPMSGDTTMTNTGAVTVTRVNGTPVSPAQINNILGLVQTTATTYVTQPITATTSEWINGMITCNMGTIGTLTSPTAAQLVAAIPGATVGLTIRTVIVNIDGTRVVNITGGTGVARVGNVAIQLADTNPIANRFFIALLTRITNIGGGTEAAIIYPS
jgi:hypothetical protein